MTAAPNNIRLDELPVKGGVRLFVLRLDLMDKVTGGNKHFKLKYNLEEARKLGAKKIVTFGGAWSNHLAAVGAKVRGTNDEAREGEGLEVIAVIRGEEPKVYSETLRFCVENGMKLHFVSREEYRRRNEPEYIEELRKKFGDFYLLPEGGSNELAVRGCREIRNEIKINFDVICCPVGSGGTLAGIASGLHPGQMALGFVALKGAEYLHDTINSLRQSANFKLIHDYHFGGFAKTTPGLLAFKQKFEKENGFELDYVYTAKMFFGIYDLIEKNYFAAGATIVAVHTGGLQGNKGFTES